MDRQLHTAAVRESHFEAMNKLGHISDTFNSIKHRLFAESANNGDQDISKLTSSLSSHHNAQYSCCTKVSDHVVPEIHCSPKMSSPPVAETHCGPKMSGPPVKGTHCSSHLTQRVPSKQYLQVPLETGKKIYLKVKGTQSATILCEDTAPNVA